MDDKDDVFCKLLWTTQCDSRVDKNNNVEDAYEELKKKSFCKLGVEKIALCN